MSAGERIELVNELETVATCARAALQLRLAEFSAAANMASLATGEQEAQASPHDIPGFNCNICGDSATLSVSGSHILAENCRWKAEGPTCELGLARVRPESFEGPNGEKPTKAVGCTGCSAVVDWQDTSARDGGKRPLLRGTCAVNEAGIRWRTEGRALLNSMSAEAITNEVPPSDGEPEPEEAETPTT